MRIEVHHIHHHEQSRCEAHLLDIKRELLMISAEVQKVLDRARQNSSLVQSVDLGMQGLSKQVSDLQAQIAALPAGNVLSDDDKAALAESAADLDTSIATLQKDIPANTPAAAPGSAGAADPGNPAPQGSDAGASSGQIGSGGDAASPQPAAPDLSNDSQHKADAEAASQAKPLGGTGQS